MKLNLLLNDASTRNGYRNIDPLSNGQDGREQGDVTNLDWAVDDAECLEIIAPDVLDFVPANERRSVVDHWVKKLRHNGVLTIGGVDMLFVAKAVASRAVDIDYANELLYGLQSAPWQYRKGTQTMSLVSQLLVNAGLQIQNRRIRTFHYSVTARRP